MCIPPQSALSPAQQPLAAEETQPDTELHEGLFDPGRDYRDGVYNVSNDDCYAAVIREDGEWFGGTADRPRAVFLETIKGGRLRGPFPRVKEAW